LPKLFLHALGCKTNQYENLALTQQLIDQGFDLVDKMQDADVGILNTCTVTAEAGRKSRQMLRRMKKQNPEALIVAMGCYAQLSDVSADCDIAVGTSQRNLIPKLILQKLRLAETSEITSQDLRPLGKISQETDYEELGIVSMQKDTRAQIKIQDGCNEFCSYCTIPLARGRIRSRSRENILREVEALVNEGHKEVVLTGIHICSFEKEKGRNSDALAELCLELNRITALERIRLGSLEPLSVTEQFLQILKGADKVCPHFHLSLQSGSDTVLQRMRRSYNTVQYQERVRMLRQIYKDPSITTDVMVGFPEETEQEFLESLEFVRRINFSKIHVFPYSVRQDTLAAKMKQVPGQITKQRAKAMLELAEDLSVKYAKQFVGRRVEVLLEDEFEDYIRGYTKHYVRTYIVNNNYQSGEIKNVLITDVRKDDLFGKIV
jgi:threonylcarbamoyladenosine tRNA methylthiotransferase MtaB